MTIRELIDGIEKLDLVFPEFQREYVWEKAQGKLYRHETTTTSNTAWEKKVFLKMNKTDLEGEVSTAN
jgi:hypothetical protein